MQKTTTKDFKVFLLNVFLPILALSLSFQVSFAQSPALKSKGGTPRQQFTAAAPAVQSNLTKAQAKSERALQAATPSVCDVPELNRQYAAKKAAYLAANPNAVVRTNTPTTNIVNDVCTFNGSLDASDLALTAGRPFRDGLPPTCAAPKTCPSSPPFGTGPYYYDTYTMQNLTCASQCVTINYKATGASGDVFVSVYNGSFNPNNLCANYMADGGSSSLGPDAVGVTFTVTVPASTTIVLVANGAQVSTACPAYTITVTGLNCTAPPACTPIGPSVLSQSQIPAPPVNLINEGFNTSVAFPGSGLPAGWSGAFNSNPLGLITVWYSGNQTGVFAPHTGADYIAANYNHAGAALGTLSSWMFAPSVLLKNGDKFSFWTCHDPGNARPDRLQVRMNTTNTGTNVGSTATSVGDFTTLLLDINPTYSSTGYPTSWTQFTVTLSGLPAGGVNGRIAFRYFCENSGGVGVGQNSDYIGIDDVVYTTYPTVNPTTCVGSTACLKVDITGGAPGATYNLVLNATPGGNFSVNNYTSGDCIPVTPAATTSYTLVSVIDASNPCCVGTGNSGNPTVTVSGGPVQAITIVDNPTGPLCAGDPKLLAATGAPGTQTNCSTGGTITINSSGTASPYPSPITVAGLPAGATVASVKLNNLNHTWTGDIDVAVTGPTFVAGGNTQACMLLSDLGNDANDDAVNTTITFVDGAPRVPNVNPIPSGTYSPTNDGAVTDAMPLPGPTTTAATPLLTQLNAATMNGTWNLWINDQVSGDGGSLASWCITFNWPAGPLTGWSFLWSPAAGLSSTTSNPVAASPPVTRQYTVIGTAPGGCQTAASITINVNQLPAVVTPPANQVACAGTNVTFTVVGTGAGLTYQWQESTTGAGGPWTNITNGGVYGGATTATLTLTGVTTTMNNYRYRCVISGTCPPAATSASALLTVNPLPNVTISPASPVCGGVAGTSGTALTASGATGTYVWTPTTGLYTNTNATTAYTGGNAATVYAAPAVNTVYTVTGTNAGTGCINTATVNVVYKPAPPIVTPASVTMCAGDPSVKLQITSSLAPAPFTSTYTNSTPFAIPDNDPVGVVSSLAAPLPTTAQITSMFVTVNMTHTWDGDVVLALKAPNGKILNLDYYLSSTGGAGATTGFTNTRITSVAGAPALSTGTNPYNGVFKADAVTTTPFGPNAPTIAGFGAANTALYSDLFPSPSGTWTLGAYDGGAGDVGTITSWSLTFNYLYGPPASGVWSPATGLWRDAAQTTAYVAGDTANIVYTRPAVSTNYNVTVTSVGFDAFPEFCNTAPITINDGSTATPYPSNITVSGIPTTGATVQNVKIKGLSHTWESDVVIALQSPSGQNNLLMASVGGANVVSNVTYTIQDGAPAFGTGANPTGTYSPTNLAGAHTFPVLGSLSAANPLSSYTGNMNGVWKLYVIDEFLGDAGNIAGGWCIQFKHPTVGCTSDPRVVPVTVNTPITVPAGSQPVNQTICTDKTANFTVGAVNGTGPFTYQWQVSTNSGNPPYTNLSNTGVYTGTNTATLTITAPPVSMSGYAYRCLVQGAAPCPAVPTNFAVLTVNPLPTVVLSAAPFLRLFPGLTTTISSTVTPAAVATGGYSWTRNGVPVAGSSNSASLLIDVDKLGDYRLTVTDVNGCVNSSNVVSILDSATTTLFIYPNPNNGVFQVRYYSAYSNVLPRGLTVYDSKGARIYNASYNITAPYARMDVDLRNFGKGVYWIELLDRNNQRLAVGRAVVQ